MSIPLSQKTVFLKIACDFKDRKDQAYFYYSLNGKDWSAIGEPLHMIYDISHFMGYRFGLFNFATKTASGFVEFDYFRLSDKSTAIPLKRMGGNALRWTMRSTDSERKWTRKPRSNRAATAG